MVQRRFYPITSFCCQLPFWLLFLLAWSHAALAQPTLTYAADKYHVVATDVSSGRTNTLCGERNFGVDTGEYIVSGCGLHDYDTKLMFTDYAGSTIHITAYGEPDGDILLGTGMSGGLYDVINWKIKQWI